MEILISQGCGYRALHHDHRDQPSVSECLIREAMIGWIRLTSWSKNTDRVKHRGEWTLREGAGGQEVRRAF